MSQIRHSYYPQRSVSRLQFKRWDRQLITKENQSQYRIKRQQGLSPFKKFETDNIFKNQYGMAIPLQLCLQSSTKMLEQRKRKGTLSLNKQIGMSRNQNIQLSNNQLNKNFGFLGLSAIYKNQRGQQSGADSWQHLGIGNKIFLNKKINQLQRLTKQLKVMSFKLHKLLDQAKWMIKQYFSEITQGIKYAIKQFLEYESLKLKKAFGKQTKGSQLKLRRKLMSKTSLSQYSEQDSLISFGNNINVFNRNQILRSPPRSQDTEGSPKSITKNFDRYIKHEQQIEQHEHQQQYSNDISDLSRQHTKMQRRQLFHSQEIIQRDINHFVQSRISKINKTIIQF